MRLALYQPDIPPNVGAMLRLGACLGIAVDIIEPCGFPLGHRDLKRAAMDYAERVESRRHRSWEAFLGQRRGSGARLVLLTTRATRRYAEFAFRPDDCLLVGRESAGVPDAVIRRAREVLENLEVGEFTKEGLPRLARSHTPGLAEPGAQMSLFVPKDPVLEKLRARLQELDTDRLTPMEAIRILAELRSKLD